MTGPKEGGDTGQAPAAAAARWEHFEHMADAGIRGLGPTPGEAFEQAALALMALVVEPEKVAARSEVVLHCAGQDLDFLLLDFINALVFEMATRHLLFGRFRVRLDQDGLHAWAWGEPLDRQRHQPAVEIKGATMTELHVRRRGDGLWEAQCVVDV